MATGNDILESWQTPVLSVLDDTAGGTGIRADARGSGMMGALTTWGIATSRATRAVRFVGGRLCKRRGIRRSGGTIACTWTGN